MRFALHIARRYLRSRRRSRFLSRVSVTAVIGIVLGVMVLDLTLAVMNGFHAELRRTFVDTMPMITISTSAPGGFADLEQTLGTITLDPDVVGASPYIRQEVILSKRRRLGKPRSRGAIAWGIDPRRIDSVQPFSRQLSPGPEVLERLAEPGAPRLILGFDLAMSLYAAIGDTVLVTAPRGDLSLDGVEAETREFTVAGFLNSGMYEFDSRFVYVTLDTARDFFGYGDAGAGLIGVQVRDMMRAQTVARRLEGMLGRDFRAVDWMELNQNLFQWVKLEKAVMFLLLGLIVLVAAFNIIGILTMMVGERRREIGILLSMGASPRQIQSIFVINGLWLGGLGTLLGSLLGWLGTQYLIHYGIPLPGEVYFVDHVPCIAQWGDFLLVGGAALVITLLATLMPSHEAAHLDPMEIVRYT